MGSAVLTLHSQSGRAAPFKVEVALTRQEQEKGLMDRPSLAADGGMLFDFGSERTIAMWMKNTLIPLDMVFISNGGRILGIAERTVPLSLDTISSPGPVRAVLEVAGGTAERLHLQAGDQIDGLPFVK
jgi:hypothetical protein